MGRLTRWWDKPAKGAGEKVREYITSQEPSERLLSGRKQMTQGLPEDILAVDQGTQQLGTKGKETAGELGEAGTRTAVREVGVAVTMAGGSRLLGEAAEGVSQELRGARESGSTATQVGTRRLPNAENPWIKYQQHVTGRSYEEMWRLNAQKVGVDASQAGYTVEAKWAGKNNAAWRSSPYNPRSEFYNEPGILDQARNLIELNKTSGGSGVRYTVSNEAARSHFEALFRQYFPNENIQVWHVPGTGMR